MGALVKLIDAILLVFFTVIAIAAPFLDAQTCLPIDLFPDVLVELKLWYTREYGDYLVAEKPSFFVGLVWLELLFQWPLSIANLYAIVTGKCWLRTTCLIYGVSAFTSMIQHSTKVNQIFTYILTIPERLRELAAESESRTKSDARVQIEAKSEQIAVTSDQIEPTQDKSNQTQPCRIQIEPPRYQIGALETGAWKGSRFLFLLQFYGLLDAK
ncbi:uncharacterized protein LOC130789602 isoform X1 [Actinidia eriantha]|uniref:uncharacterized protein LOC130789602 isoform X1 n=1 Tax=Actinidia eriantha TaxID=165200 RepID=UPI00258702AF|nr:uncharacterized protein LOC130789602 isoform X1 [Actinidia eriantha]